MTWLALTMKLPCIHSKTLPNPFIDDQSEEVIASFQMSYSDSATRGYSSPSQSSSPVEPQSKRRCVVVISTDSDE